MEHRHLRPLADDVEVVKKGCIICELIKMGMPAIQIAEEMGFNEGIF
jgi:hypothetical protein